MLKGKIEVFVAQGALLTGQKEREIADAVSDLEAGDRDCTASTLWCFIAARVYPASRSARAGDLGKTPWHARPLLLKPRPPS